MYVSEVMGSRLHDIPKRAVGIQYPAHEQHRLMAAGVDLLREFGIDCEIDQEQLRLTVYCGEAISGHVMALLERRTGRPGYNDWWADV